MATKPASAAPPGGRARRTRDDALADDLPAARGLGQFGAIRIRPAFHHVVAVLVDAIRSGYYRVGDRLPPERELATELKVSRPVVREALDVLERAGVVEVRRGRFGGTTLMSLNGITEILSDLHGEPIEPIAQILEVRLVLETLACLRASERAQSGDIALLREIAADAAATAGDFDAFVEHTVRFYIVIAVLSGNPTLAEFLRLLANRAAVAGLRGEARPTPKLERTITAMMDNLVTAIEQQDRPAIERLVHEHVTSVTERFG